MNNFDLIASVYDSLAGLFFGRSIKSSQVSVLHLIPEGSTILILGGGTGWILDELDRHTSNSRIWYVDQSAKMIALASSRSGVRDISFIQGSINSIPQGQKFDVIITNFFLDLFPDLTLRDVLSVLSVSLKSGGLWLVTDFVNKQWWHNMYLFIMYRFFRLTTGIEANKLPQWEEQIAALGVVELDKNFFYGGFIKSGVYKKPNSC